MGRKTAKNISMKNYTSTYTYSS